ncbi:MAG: hypothetical protein [Bacteriophage sp.]|nr:MAG: hypothetical protein [Bacteriophage sp.]
MLDQAEDTGVDTSAEQQEREYAASQERSTQAEQADTDDYDDSDDDEEVEQPEEVESDEDDFYLGDEKLESPTSDVDDNANDTELVKHLRKQIKERNEALREAKRQPQQAAPAVLEPLPQKPQLSDDGIDYDENVYQQRLEDWFNKKAGHEAKQRDVEKQQQELQDRFAKKNEEYAEAKKKIKVPGYDAAEQLVKDEVPENIRSALMLHSKNPTMVVIALARNPELRKQMSEATDPIEFGYQLGRIDALAKTMPKAKSTTSSAPNVKGGVGANVGALEKELEKARSSGDYTRVIEIKKKLAKAK